MFISLNNPERFNAWDAEINAALASIYEQIERTVLINQAKVLDAYKQAAVSAFDLYGSDGYGYNDSGRDKLEQVYAHIFGTETALVRPQFVSGTHAITAALFGNCRPGDEIIYAAGEPYETMKEVLGFNGDSPGSFDEYGIDTKIVPLTSAGEVDVPALLESCSPRTKWIVIQRSRGYDERPSITIAQIGELIKKIKADEPTIHIFIDNCYGEFVEEKEPGEVGADLLAGSLIKNPGAGFSKTGGYIAGKASFVEQAANRLSAPGIGLEAGATGEFLKDAYQGFFLAPMITGQALKGAHYTAALFNKAGFKTSPAPADMRTDLIQAVQFSDAEQMVTFCQAIQAESPVDAYVKPIPGPLPGYDGDVIMAAGTFVQGASIELSADGPVKPPYIAYVQGGLSFEHVKIAVIRAMDEMLSI